MAELTRVLRTPGAVLLGLGSMVGTGVFISIGLGASVLGSGVLIAIVIAGFLALCNGLSSAQLAANHPISGGTYEYGYRYLRPTLGFTAGWTFLIAKSASAATAALGASAYLVTALGLSPELRIPLALLLAVVITGVVLTGLRRSNRMNLFLVVITIGTLFVFALPPVATGALPHLDLSTLFSDFSLRSVLEATALMFVAYTGYGRVATLGEEVVDPRRTVPRAVMMTVGLTAILYLLVGIAAIGMGGAAALAGATLAGEGPLGVVARLGERAWMIPLLTLGAITAMLGVLLNLILGLSRVILAMGRRGDAPERFASVNLSGATPVPAVIAVGLLVTGLTLLGDVMTTWSLSAFSVLIYYGITNLAALRLSAEERFYPRIISIIGLLGCLILAWWVEPMIWITGLGLILLGLILRTVFLRSRRSSQEEVDEERRRE